MDASTISARIRLARANSGLSQTELARCLGVNRATVAHWEREDGFSPTLGHLQAMSDALGVTLIWLTQQRGLARCWEKQGVAHLVERVQQSRFRLCT